MQPRGPDAPPNERAQSEVDYADLVELVDAMETPVTVDQVVDSVFERRVALGPVPDSWHDIHEELYLVDLPRLDSADLIELDEERGLVDS
jgi:hypothetical protein